MPAPAPAPPELPELVELQRIVALGESLASEHWQSWEIPLPQDGVAQVRALRVVALGNPSPEVPAIGFFGGVHGLERIGSQVVISFLSNLVSRLGWDESLQRQLQHLRMVFLPVVNPGGMQRGTRANPNGVDLMRNAPVDAVDPVPFLVGGQRLSPGLPWYRGRQGAPMEPESAALCALVERELYCRPFSLALDCHSGFGMRDRIWFPFAHRRRPIEHLPQLHALHEIFIRSNTHHPYVFEPQSRQYLTHGDLWDHLYLRACERADTVFLPLTLEMGSWLWIKKNPRQLFSRLGIFNPLIAHREQRVLRRHLPLFDFAMRAAAAWRQWLPDAAGSERHQREAMARWYATEAL